MFFRYTACLLSGLIYILLSGCASVDTRIKDMLLKTDPDTVNDNMEWVIEELREEETDYPENYAKIMQAGRQLANKADIANKNSAIYNQFVEVLVILAKKPPVADDVEDWLDKSMAIEPTRDYISAYAIHQLGQLKGPAIGEQILTLLRGAKSEGVRTTALHAMLENMSTYTSSDESRAQALAGIAGAKATGSTGSEEFQSVFNAVEEKIVNQTAINTVLQKYKVYNLNDNAISYILSVNERLWNYYLESGKLPPVSQLQNNVRYLSLIALPRKKQFDGAIPNFTKSQLKAQQLLLVYAPGLYYFNMYENAKISDYSFGQLLATLSYMDEMDGFAKTAGDKLVAVNKKGRKYFNHRKLLNERIYTANRIKAIAYVFKNLSKRVDYNTPRYRAFYYSQLSALFPQRFAVHLNKIMQQKFRDSTTDLQQAYFAANLILNKRVKSNTQGALKNRIYNMPLKRTMNYEKKAYDDFANLNFPYFIQIDTTLYISSSNKNASNAAKVVSPGTLASYYVTGLEKLPTAQQSKYHRTLGFLLSRHIKDVSRQISGYLQTRPAEESIKLFEKYVVSEPKKVTEDDFILLGNLMNKRYSKLNSSQKTRIVNLYRIGVSKAPKIAALRAAQEGLDFTQKRSGSKLIANDISIRWPQIKVPTL
jgi:hypothetical protein